MVKYVFDDPEGLSLFGYSHLEFWINGGEGSGQDPMIAGKRLSGWGAVPERNTWTVVSIPASELTAPLTSVGISGRVQDRFYIDDMKLVAMELRESSAVEESEAAVLPSGYRLSQNYPNPFNPQTTIQYALPEAGEVRLSVYNVAGQRIRTLVDGHHSVGRYSVVWDGKNDRERDVGSGIYVYRLEVESQAAHIRRMVLIR